MKHTPSGRRKPAVGGVRDSCGGPCFTITMCCWKIVETLQTAEHCVVFVDGNAISAHPVGLFRDLVGAAYEENCPGLNGFWGTIAVIDAEWGADHPDYLYWMEHHNGGMISEDPLAPSMPSTCASELSCNCRISSAEVLSCLRDFADGLKACCVSYQLLGDIGPNSNSFAFEAIKRCACDVDAEILESRIRLDTVFGAVGGGGFYQGWCEDCPALCAPPSQTP